MPGKHARLSPSGADRWMTCAGSVSLCAMLPDTPSADGDEGTAAHFLASEALTSGRHPANFLKRRIGVTAEGACWVPTEPGGYWTDLAEGARVVFEVDAEMAANVNDYVQAVLACAKDAVFTGYEVELPLFGVTQDDEEDVGTADTIIVTPDGVLEVHDLKYGYNYVAVENNRQLRIYALAALDAYDMLYDIRQVKLFIHQPRLPGASGSWEVSLEDLAKFREEVQKAAMLVGLPDAPFAPSEKACEYCKAKKLACCSALDAFVSEAASLDFDDLSAGTESPDGLTYEALATKLSACNLVEDWAKAVRARGLALANQGVSIPHWKLVQGRKGNRAWRDTQEAETTLKSMRLKVEEMYDMAVITPTAAECIFGPKGSAPSTKRWNKLEALITRKDGKPTLVPDTDKRPPLEVDRAADFEPLIDDDEESMI